MSERADKSFPPLDSKLLALRWLSGQSFTNVLLVLILCAFVWFVDKAMNMWIPAHIAQLQSGYERIEKSHERQIELVVSRLTGRATQPHRSGESE
jgi:hypothetical protein